MEEYELELEYDEERFFEDKYNDDFDALDDFEDGSTTKSKALSSTRTKQNFKEDSFKILDQKLSFAVEEIDEEEVVETSRNPGPKRQKVEDDLQDNQEDAQSLPEEDRIPCQPRFQREKKKYVYQMPQFGKNYINVTDTEGRRVFLPVLEPSDMDTEDAKPRINKLNLLSTPIESLIQSVEDKHHLATVQQINNIKNIVNGNFDAEMMDAGSEIVENYEPEVSLWVEKYHPRRFTELLSDDGINRILLKWMKLWDEFVFGKSKKSLKKSKPETIKQGEKQNKYGKRKQNWDYEEEMELDHTGRPKYKIALLSGSPGLGKTTLAHIVARHAGYNPVEMNASDDRSAELFKNKLETSTQMISCMGEGNRPNCLIIDEIDGAPVQAINILLQAIKDTEESNKKKKKSKQITITRPIICICNDLYVPALRQLRQSALSLSVPQISPSRLAQRLLEISRKQKMKADIGCLLALCDKSENDIRSCVNTLQFIFKKHGELNALHLQDISIGQKDFHKGLYFVLKSVFQLPKPSRKHFGLLSKGPRNGFGQSSLAFTEMQSNLGNSTMQTSNSVRFHNILHLASTNSEFEKMTQGLFDNYLNVKSKDPHLDSIVVCTSWLQFGDRLETKIRSEQSYSLMKFYPLLPVAFHMLLASALPPRLTYTNSAIEFNTRFSRSKQIWESVICDVKPNVKRYVENTSAILDLFPYIYEIIHPTLRPVNIQLYTLSEKQQLLSLISTMISYNLGYHQERNTEGQYTYVLQPNIGEIISFPNLPQHKQLSYGAKQLIQREIELEKMRKIENSLQQMAIDTEKKSSTKGKQVKKTDKLQPIAVKHEKTKPMLDFFGREIVRPKDTGQKKEKKSSLINTQVWYKFNEGYSNAVKRTVKIKDFL